MALNAQVVVLAHVFASRQTELGVTITSSAGPKLRLSAQVFRSVGTSPAMLACPPVLNVTVSWSEIDGSWPTCFVIEPVSTYPALTVLVGSAAFLLPRCGGMRLQAGPGLLHRALAKVLLKRRAEVLL